MPQDEELRKQGTAPPGQTPATGESRSRSGTRTTFSVPDLARRGRETLRHLAGLLLGGVVAATESRRRRGARGLLFGLQRMVAAFLRLFLDSEIVRLPFPLQLRRRLELLGPTYVKLGQMLSVRRDIIPDVVTEELGLLFRALPASPFAEIRAIVEADLGRPPEEVFTFLDPEPVGSASIAQTHRAVTHDGEQVILKVVKPGIKELLERDASLLRIWGRVLQTLLPRFQPRRLIDEFFDYTVREADMIREAESCETFAANFRDMPEVHFPRIYRQYSGGSVLCMEYLVGLPPDSETAAALPIEERRALIDLGASAILRMLYEDGYFHADLHPGNLLILGDNRIGFIDLGMVGRLDPQLRRSLLFHFYCLVIEDFENAARHLVAVAQLEPRSDVVGFRQAAKELARRWRRAAAPGEFSLAKLVLESLRLGARYRIYFPAEMVLLVKALLTYEGLGFMLDPQFNVAEVSQRHVGLIMRHQLSPMRLLREAARSVPDLFDTLVKLPTLVSEGLRLLEREARRQPEPALAGLRATLLGGACLISGAVLAAVQGPWPAWSGLMLLGIFIALRRGR